MPSRLLRWTALALLGAVDGADEPRSTGPPRPHLRLLQRAPSALLILEASRAAAVSVCRGRPPPLRDILGQCEESALVEEDPPSIPALAIRALVLILIYLPVMLVAPLALFPGPLRRIWYDLSI